MLKLRKHCCCVLGLFCGLAVVGTKVGNSVKVPLLLLATGGLFGAAVGRIFDGNDGTLVVIVIVSCARGLAESLSSLSLSRFLSLVTRIITPVAVPTTMANAKAPSSKHRADKAALA